MKLIKKFLRSAKSKGGYTLIEVAAVVAITATLGAVVVPIAVDKTNEGKVVAARDSCKSIGGAISGFYKDIGYWPGAGSGSGSGTTYYRALRSGTEYNVTYGAPHDPTEGNPINGKWSTYATTVDNLDNHLVRDNPGVDISTAAKQQNTANNTYLTSLKLNWKGPYSENFKNSDPWGNNYLVYVKAMHTATTGGTKEYGWIISAGPNSRLETGVLDSTLQGDDIGYPLFSLDAGH